jgi:electron transfer flavoprotein alpha subunit
MAILVLAEHTHTSLTAATFIAVGAARQLGAPVHALLIGHNSSPAAQQAANIAGVDKVIHVQGSAYQNAVAEQIAPILVLLAKNYTHIVAPATTYGKNILPRVAALCDVQQISDVSAILSPDTFEHPVYAGNAIARVRSTDSLKILTVRTTAFSAAENAGGSGVIEDFTPPAPPTNQRAVFFAQELSKSERPELASARIVVSGGRGLGSKENFAVLEKLADRLGAAVGASRAAVDAGYVPNDYQVGQTGKVVAPDLYIAIGISGAIQHLAGMKDSKVIVAINKDPDAPIFSVADYGLVGDLFEITHELTAKLSQQ